MKNEYVQKLNSISFGCPPFALKVRLECVRSVKG